MSNKEDSKLGDSDRSDWGGTISSDSEIDDTVKDPSVKHKVKVDPISSRTSRRKKKKQGFRNKVWSKGTKDRSSLEYGNTTTRKPRST